MGSGGSAKAPSVPRGTRFGPYELLYTLGAGGMGQVFLARHVGEHGIARLVAVKRILAHLSRNKRLVELFLDEVRIAAQLNHGNVVQVVDHGLIDGAYFMAMEYVHGENLSEVLARLHDRGERMPLDLLLHVMCCACEGLEHAHAKRGLDGRPLGVVHRDVSPHNVLISFGGQVKIADFGVARAAEQSHQTAFGELRGKLSYMSPEQAYGRALDHRSDLFSLGIVLYEALSGRNPFLRDNPMATLEAVRAAQVARLSLVRADLPADLVALTHRLMSPDADGRPASARDAHEELSRVMRLNNMAVSPFDLGDYLGDLFPASRAPSERSGAKAAKTAQQGQAGTAVGRRADDLTAATKPSTPPGRNVMTLEPGVAVGPGAGDEGGGGDEVVRQTLYYLEQRHPDAPPTDAGDLTLPPADTASLRQLIEGEAAAPAPSSSEPGTTGTVLAPPRRPTWPWLLAILLVGGGVGAAVIMRGSGGSSGASGTGTGSGAAGVAGAASGTGTGSGVAAGVASGTGKGAGASPRTGTGTGTAAGVGTGTGTTAATARAFGRVRVLSLPPGATVLVDGRVVGKAPVTRRLRVGAHRVQARLRGYASRRRSVFVRGNMLTVATLTLDARPARIHVTSTHPCTVSVDGKALGTSPQQLKVKPGSHSVSCRAVGKGIRVKRRVRVQPGATARLALRFGVLAVNVQPWAHVSVDGRARGQTPLRLVLAAGEHRVLLVNGKRRRSRNVLVRAGRIARISAW